jgi:menaquinone-dependent protoporphyrinogen IX oxidase
MSVEHNSHKVYESMVENGKQENNISKKALVVYSSQSGCTEEVARKIREKLESSSIQAELVKINEKGQLKALLQRDLGQYSGILVGSSIAVGKIHKDVKKFLEKLEATPVPQAKLGLFISCMKARSAEHVPEAKAAYIDPVLQGCGLKFALVDAFGGVIDFSPSSSLNGMIKGILKKIMLQENPDIKEIESKIYDFRDWQQIEKFGSTWASIIKEN